MSASNPAAGPGRPGTFAGDTDNVPGATPVKTPKSVHGITLDTDRSINCATLKTIVADVTRGCKSDRDRAIAIYNFMVRVVYMPWHSHQPLEMRPYGDLEFVNDPLKYISVYGCCGCGPQASLFGSVMEAAGLKMRRLHPGFGHISSEFFWEDKWHWLDIWLPAYVTDKEGRIPSYDEIMADRTLFSMAKEEARAPGNFMTMYDEDFATVMNAKGSKPLDGNAYPQQYVENLALRPGESCTWLWDNVGKWYWPSGPWKLYKPLYLHGQFECGPACKFANDQVLTEAFPYWEPYVKTIKGGPHDRACRKYYRYYGNAIFTSAPPLTRRGLDDVGAKVTGLEYVPGGGLKLAKPAAGQVQMLFNLPYVIADTEIEGDLTRMTAGGCVSFSYSLDGGETWFAGDEVREPGAFTVSIGRPNSFQHPAGSTSGQYGFTLRIVLRTNSAETPTVLKNLKVTSTTMLNFYSRPWLETGVNNVTVTAANGRSLTTKPLEVTWRWLEDRKTPGSFTHKVARNRARAVVKVGGTKCPKMQSVTIACPAR